MNKWDIRAVKFAYSIAEYSKDPVTRVGCVVASLDRRQFYMGYNGFPVGIKDSIDRLMSKQKNSFSLHAEINAILNARADLTGCSLYTTKPPCTDCCKVIIQAGIKEVFCPAISDKSTWSSSQLFGHSLLIESGINVVHFKDIFESGCDNIDVENNSIMNDSGVQDIEWCECEFDATKQTCRIKDDTYWCTVCTKQAIPF